MIIATITSLWTIIYHVLAIPDLRKRRDKKPLAYSILVAVLSVVMLWHPVPIFYLIMSGICLSTLLTGYKKVLADTEVDSGLIDVRSRVFYWVFHGLVTLNMILNGVTFGVLMS